VVHEPEAWLDDYLQTIKVHGGTKATTIQSLQLFLSETREILASEAA
jgi:hypothetical protein